MRIDKLQLSAFGPFTDVVLDLSGGNEGFHLVCGPNEAGKSSALRALRQLFYGIPPRSVDNFLHPYPQMRIGATLRTRDGGVLEILRRKGRSRTLRGPDDITVLAESRLQRFLGGVDADLFATMFGIGYEDLVRGGQDILQGGGDVGRLVFSAGSGIANLREIQNELQAEADRFFRPSGQKQVINAALGRLNRSRSDLKAAQLPGQEWIRHDAALRRALDRKAGVQAALARNQRQYDRLQRIRQALPLIAKRTQLTDDLKAYADDVRLPEAFPAQRRDLMAKLAAAESQERLARKNIDAHHRAIAKRPVSSGLLDASDVVEDLHLELGSQSKAARDRVHLETRRDASLAEARAILITLGEDRTFEEAEKRRIQKAEAVKIKSLGVRYERIMARMEGEREKLPGIYGEIAEIEGELSAMPVPRDTAALRTTLAAAEAYAAQEAHHRAEQTEIESAVQTAAVEQRKLGLAERSFQDLERLAVPVSETVRIFEDRFDASDRQLADYDQTIRKISSELRGVDRQIETNRLEQEVPTEADLHRARSLRDRGWSLIARKMNGAPLPEAIHRNYLAEMPGATGLVDAFEAGLRQADAIADRLRREADRVAAKARLLVEQKALNERFQQLTREQAAAADQRTRLADEWAGIWQPLGIKPRSPREMGRWCGAFRLLAERLKDLRIRRARHDRLQKEIETHQRHVDQSLRELDLRPQGSRPTLTTLVKQGLSVVAEEEARQRRCDQLFRDKRKKESELKMARSRLDSGEKDLDDWQRQWEKAVRPIGLGAGARPDEAAAVMDELNRLFEKLKETGILKKRIEGIDRDAAAFGRKVAGLVALVAPDVSGRPAAEAVLALHRRLKQSSAAQTQRETLQRQLAQEEKHLKKIAGRTAEYQARLKSLCAEAGCDSIDALPGVEQRSDRRRALESEMKSVDDQLCLLSGGAPVDNFITEALAMDPDGIAREIEDLADTIDRMNVEKSALDQKIGSEQTELSRMDGSGKAAEVADEIQFTLSGIENSAEQYARLKIATKVLSMAIERYRDKSQGPILRRASALFRQITGAAFQGLRAEYDDKGRPVIVGVRYGNGEIVPVEAMSDGTADQLYLALRLAGLEMYLSNNEPLPFIVDDILIKFDNERAVATLKALAGIAGQTQLIFFTHHDHLVELARKHLDPSTLFFHNLGKDGEPSA